MVLGGFSIGVAAVIIGMIMIMSIVILPVDEIVVGGIGLTLAGILATLIPFLGGLIPVAIMTVVFTIVSYYLYKNNVRVGGLNENTSDSGDLVGKTGIVVETIPASGTGTVKLEGGGFSRYSATAEENKRIEEGESVMVMDPGGGNIVSVAVDEYSQVSRTDTEKEVETN